MQHKRFITKITLQNLLSFGPKGVEVELLPLNILIGPNGSGKSNFIEAFELLRATPGDLTKPIIEGGGIREWLWKGTESSKRAVITTVINYNLYLQHKISFSNSNEKIKLNEEVIDNFLPGEGEFYYKHEEGKPIEIAIETLPKAIERKYVKEGDFDEVKAFKEITDLKANEVLSNQSILTQKRDKKTFPELTFIGDNYKEIRIYKEWILGNNSPIRNSQDAAMPNDFLLESASNLGLIINDFEHRGIKNIIVERIKKFYEAFEDIHTLTYGGRIQLYIREKGLADPIPAIRISDGTLRYLCLLTILLHPDPPPLICIEEPEIGMHPDIIPDIAELLVDASQRTQLIVTTHSDILVSALSDTPESIVVCERDDNGTSMRRLDPELLKDWLDKYLPGELWLTGEIGGTRW